MRFPTFMIVHEDNCLEILKDVGPKLELEAKTVKSAQAFQAIPKHIICQKAN